MGDVMMSFKNMARILNL